MTDGTERDDTPEEDVDNGSSARRKFLGRGGIALAAAAAGVVAMSEPAGATDGDFIQIGVSSSGSGNNSRTSVWDTSLRVTVNATNNNRAAIEGIHPAMSTSAIGVLGEASASSATGVGVKGLSGAGIGVLGEAISETSNGTGVKGHGMAVGVIGEGGSSTVVGTGVIGRSHLGPALKLDSGLRNANADGQITVGTWQAGSFVNSGGHVYYCWKAGTGANSRWVKLSGAPVILSAGYRAFDSREGKAPLGVTKGKLAHGTTRSNIDLTVGSGGKLPTGISAVLLNLTVTNTGPAGYLTAYKNGIARPGVSSMNWTGKNSNLANTTIVPVDASSRISVYCEGGAHVIIDVIGYLP